MKVTAVVHKADEGGFWAEVPSPPGCRTQGDTMYELKANLREPVELYFETAPSGLTADKNSQLLELAVRNKFWQRFLPSFNRSRVPIFGFLLRMDALRARLFVALAY